jgi:hypothetical protein
MNEPPRQCPLGLSESEIADLRSLAHQAEILRSVAKAHSALLLITHVVKWLSAIAGGLVLLKGLDIW